MSDSSNKQRVLPRRLPTTAQGKLLFVKELCLNNTATDYSIRDQIVIECWRRMFNGPPGSVHELLNVFEPWMKSIPPHLRTGPIWTMDPKTDLISLSLNRIVFRNSRYPWVIGYDQSSVASMFARLLP